MIQILSSWENPDCSCKTSSEGTKDKGTTDFMTLRQNAGRESRADAPGLGTVPPAERLCTVPDLPAGAV